jgi:signal transduction histidine kinase
VSTALPLGDSPATVVAVQAQDAFSSVEPAGASLNAVGALRLAPGDSSEGRLLGPSFPGIKAEFVALEREGLFAEWDAQRSFYLLTLLLVLGVTLFGAYLLWRDVRRELRLAELRTQFVSGVSHELKTPLTAIRMFAETLRMRRPTDPQMQDEYLDTIVNESERLSRLLNNVLDFSKIEQGNKQYQPEPCSLAEIVEVSANAMQYPLQQQGFELHVDTTDDLPSVDVDRDAIEQAVLNLLTNAMKYSGESRDIDLRLSKCNGDALIEVSDRGVGIEPEEQTRIFERFYRAHTPENDHIPGTGLGLTLVEHIAKAHGGRVTVQSVPTKGSTFSLHLPLESSRT